MVNKKLSCYEEDQIYMDYLAGKSCTGIAKNYPVVPSTVGRVVAKKKKLDGLKNNHTLFVVFKHLKNANDPLELALKTFEIDENEVIHEKQKEYLIESVKKISQNLEILIEAIEKLKI